MPKSMLARFLMVQIAIALGVVIAVAAFSFHRVQANLATRDRQIVTREILRLSSPARDDEVRRKLDELEKADSPVLPDIFVAYLPDLGRCSAAGAVTIASCAEKTIWLDPLLGREPLDLKVEPALAAPGLRRVREIETPSYNASAVAIGKSGVVLVGIDRRAIERQFAHDRLLVTLLVTFYTALSAGAAVAFVIGTTRRIERINTALDDVAAGATAARIGRHGRDEIGTLSFHIDRMLDRIDTLIASLRRFTDQMAHEMRTPLTRVRARLENIELNTDANIPSSRIDACLADLDGLIELFNAILQVARMESLTPEDLRPVDLMTVVTTVTDIYEAAAQDRKQRIDLRLAPLPMRGNEALLQRLVANILDNAIKFSAEGGCIELACGWEDGTGFLTISDRGRGLSPAERHDIFKLGVRTASSLSVPGTGFGLYVVHQIAQLHGMTISVEDNKPGLRMRFTFAAE